ncbi:ParB/RepB/Spo0J family partition protein (plasmid) [Thioclava sp. 'Guangxiensis']|uniref:ParB/RepB/Spo0J family partition protein n=1 Tax=Thioclava sp. 'Guangxiensis' TaxID=3149044 RepID=UPI0038779D7F
MVAVAEVDTSNRLRPVTEAGVASLIASIEELTVMKDPIHVRQKKGGALVLIAGGHRLEAAKRLGWEEIEAKIWTDVTDDWSRLMEIDDNLAGAEMDPLDTAVFLAERQRVYEKLHPETKAATGADLVGKRWNTADKMSVVCFAEATAQKFGITDRHVRRMVAAGKALAPEDVRLLREAPKAVGLSDLQLIGKLEPTSREAVVKALIAGEAKSAAKALKAIKTAASSHIPQSTDPHDQAFLKLADLWSRTSAVARRRFLDEFGDQVMRFMPDQGGDDE